MKSETIFEYSNKGECQYKVGQLIPEFAPMNLELKISFNEKSLDIIIGVAIDPKDVWRYLNCDGLSISLFVYQNIPALIVTGGYFQVAGNIVLKNAENINPQDWVNGTDEYVNLVLVNDFENYEVLDIRRIRLPMMKTIRNILKQQLECYDAEIGNALSLIEKGFQTPWMLYYQDEECLYDNETPDEIQKGTYIVHEPKEKRLHVY